MGNDFASGMHLESELRDLGLRITRQRAAILNVLAKMADQPDAAEIHRRAQRLDPSVALSTVYRTLGMLADHGLIHREHLGGMSARVGRIDFAKKGQIVDIDTGEITPFDSSEAEQFQDEIAKRHGFVVVGRRFEIFCRKDRRTTAGTGS